MKRIFRIILPLFCMALLIGGCEKKDYTTESGTNATETLPDRANETTEPETSETSETSGNTIKDGDLEATAQLINSWDTDAISYKVKK